MVDLEFLLRERGTEVDATWEPVTTSEVFARADQVETQVAAPLLLDNVKRRHPMTVAVVAGVAALLLFLPILLLITSQEVADNPPPSTVSPPTTSAEATGGLVLYTNVEDGYEVLLPQSWVESATEPDGQWFEANSVWPGVRYFGFDVADEKQALVITIGRPDGTVCQPKVGGECREVVLETIEGIEAHVRSDVKPSNCESESHEDLTLAGVPGRAEFPLMRSACPGIVPGSMVYAYTIHEGRPVILSFAYGTAFPGPFGYDSFATSAVRRIVESFRFLEPAAEPDQTPRDLVLYTNIQDGYELLLPRTWVDSESEPHPGMRRFGSAAFEGPWDFPALTISIGSPDGSVWSCLPGGGCVDVVLPTHLAIRDQLLTQGPNCHHWFSPGHTLGGVEAGVVSPRSAGSCMGTPMKVYAVFTVYEERPVILVFDSLTERSPEWAEKVDQIIASFRFLEPSSSS